MTTTATTTTRPSAAITTTTKCGQPLRRTKESDNDNEVVVEVEDHIKKA